MKTLHYLIVCAIATLPASLFAFTISGTVTTGTPSVPLGGVKMVVISGLSGTHIDSTTTANDGTYTLTAAIAVGSNEYMFSKPGYKTAMTSGGCCSIPSTINVTLTLNNNSSILKGMVVDTVANIPIESATVVLSGGVLSSPRGTKTDSLGSYEFDSVGTGAGYVLTAMAPKYYGGEANNVSVAWDSVVTQNLNAYAVTPISGTPAIYYPYVSGKQENTVVLNKYSSNQIQFETDAVQVGNFFAIQPFSSADGFPEVLCNQETELGLEILVPGGIAQEALSSDTNWEGYSQYPFSSLVSLGWEPGNCTQFLGSNTCVQQSIIPGPGYVFGDRAWSCNQGDVFSAAGSFNRVIFIQNGNLYGKIQITGFAQTNGGEPTDPITDLNSVTVRYLVSDNPDDLTDVASALRSVSLQKNPAPEKFDSYNLLGRKLGSGIDPDMRIMDSKGHSVVP